MQALAATPVPVVSVDLIDGRPITTSLNIARSFGKRHTNVLRAITKLDCTTEFSRLNFEPADYVDTRGKRQLAFRITRDGFAFLAMGFTGSRAAQWKEAYIRAFNEMESRMLPTAGRSQPALPAGIALNFPSTLRPGQMLEYRQMHDCGWSVLLPEVLQKLQLHRGQRVTLEVHDVSGLIKELQSLMHHVEMQHHRLSEINRISSR